MAVNVNKLEKFSGDKGSIRPESWLKLYELETGKLDEVDRINNLIYYLSKDALEWFADEILSNASIKKWDTVKLKLIQRFGYKVESPIVAASKRRLKKEETVEDYFRDKIRLLNQTSLNNVEKLKMLTDGLPLDWKNYLVTAQPKDPSHWMLIAMEIEQNNNQIRQQQRSKTKVFNITAPTISKNCPYWCPICKKKGLYFKHWISDWKDYDPNYKDKLKHQATNITTDVKQTIADSLCIANTNFPYRFVNVEVLLNNIPVSSFIDTGSTISLMSCSLLKQHKLKLNVNDRIKIKQVDSFAYTLGSVEVFLKIHSKLAGCKLHVVKNFSYPLLIGLDVAGKIGLIIDTKDKAVYVKGNECFYISPETHLPSVQQKELNQLLKENQALFSQHETDIGRIAVQHKIHTIEHPPISCRPYRRPLAEYDEIKRQVEELSKKGLIRESQSPWAFPVVLVSKKDGSQRMCIDYRKLNAITIDDKQPLPYIQDMFDRLHNAKYFTTLDIAWGYWHVEIHPDSVEKTAFITNDGHYEFLVMPFGLKNAPSTFQRIIQHIIGNLLWNGVCNYQDDILIYSSTFKDHIELLKKIFDKLKENNIKLKLKKCSFAKQEIRYLGHIIGHNKIKPDPEKTKAINEFPQPKTVKQVRQFLGLAGYYRKFIPKFSEIADPLTSLTRKNKLFKWTTEVNKSFQELKSHLSTDPVLSTYDPSLPCKLYTDASKLGIGAILAQIGNDNQEHVISYYSGKLLPHQQNYSAFELECFAVVQSVEYFEVYLENNTFEVITDHSALEWLFNVKKPKAKYLRWIIELSTKSMKIVHRSGSKQTHVDALSRSPVSFHISIPTLRLHQQKADLSFVKNSHIHRDLIMVKHNGVLKTVVPESFQEEILKEYHDNHSHPSINKTVKLITPFYWWPNAIKCIKDYVRSCKICQITKCSHKPFIGEYVAPNSDLKPLELISMDTIVLGSAANETKHKYIQMNDTILTKLRTNLQENPRLKWSSLLAKIVKDYNSTPHDVTGFSPYFLLFGDCAIPEFSESPHFTIENARKKAIENSAKHREKWKARHDAKHPQSSFKVGDLVLRKIASNDPMIVAVYACGVDVEKGPIRQQLWNAPPCDNVESWGAIAYDSRSPLLRIQGTMTAQRYVDDVLRPVTLPYLQGVPNALYQQDNPRPHTARISQQALQDVQMLPWPPYSPDLSPSEHVWDIIGRRLHALPQPRSEDELWQMVEREWRAIPQDAIRTLIDSLPRRVAACIAVRDLMLVRDDNKRSASSLRVASCRYYRHCHRHRATAAATTLLDSLAEIDRKLQEHREKWDGIKRRTEEKWLLKEKEREEKWLLIEKEREEKLLLLERESEERRLRRKEELLLMKRESEERGRRREEKRLLRDLEMERLLSQVKAYLHNET
ncbi:K02A2.6-like, partial [Cordylochernes scorpioides]